jgi:hypothetical protein
MRGIYNINIFTQLYQKISLKNNKKALGYSYSLHEFSLSNMSLANVFVDDNGCAELKLDPEFSALVDLRSVVQ